MQSLADNNPDIEAARHHTEDTIPSTRGHFIKKERATWPMLNDPGGAVAKEYGVRPMPQTMFVGPRRQDLTVAYYRARCSRRVSSTPELGEDPRRRDRDDGLDYSSQVKKRAARSGAPIAHTISTTSSSTGNERPLFSAARTVSDSAAAGSSLANTWSASGRRSSG